MKRWTLYIVECADKSLYTGITTDIGRRIAEHNGGTASKYTRGRTPVKLKYSEALKSESSAKRREFEIKKLSRQDKVRLIK